MPNVPGVLSRFGEWPGPYQRRRWRPRLSRRRCGGGSRQAGQYEGGGRTRRVGFVGGVSRLYHLVPVISAGQDLERLAQDLRGLTDHDPGAVADHRRRVVLLLTGDGMIENLG